VYKYLATLNPKFIILEGGWNISRDPRGNLLGKREELEDTRK